jgi:hypothetical protein
MAELNRLIKYAKCAAIFASTLSCRQDEEARMERNIRPTSYKWSEIQQQAPHCRYSSAWFSHWDWDCFAELWWALFTRLGLCGAFAWVQHVLTSLDLALHYWHYYRKIWRLLSWWKNKHTNTHIHPFTHAPAPMHTQTHALLSVAWHSNSWSAMENGARHDAGRIEQIATNATNLPWLLISFFSTRVSRNSCLEHTPKMATGHIDS